MIAVFLTKNYFLANVIHFIALQNEAASNLALKVK